MATDTPFTPTQHPFTGSNYPDKKTILSAYRRMVATHIETAEARETLQQSLKEFHSSLAVEELMENLKKVLNSPRRRPVYLAVRALIPSRLRDEYDSLIPHIPSNERKDVQLFQKDDQSMGFSIRGGIEYGCGVFVSEVLPSSKAAQAGLKVGYEIARVNGFTLCESTHDEVINLIKLKKKLLLSCKVVGMIPEQKGDLHELVWKAVGVDRKVSKSRLDSDGPILRSTKKIQITQEGDSLGISVKTGPSSQNGVVIVEVIPNSSADNAGLKPGDELIEVNGDSLINISHHQAIELFKKAGSLLMLTVKVKDDRKRSGAAGLGGGHYDPLAHPPDNFELLPQDFDIDAEITPDIQLDYHSAFMLKPREGEQPREAKQLSATGVKSTNRLSMLDLEAEPSKGAPTIASPAALGYGPTLALPTLTQMVKNTNMSNNNATKDQDDSTAQDQDMSLLNVSGRILDASITGRYSVDFTTIGDVPSSLAHLFNQQKPAGGDSNADQGTEKFNLDMDELQSKQEEMLRKAQQKEREDTATTSPVTVAITEEEVASKKLAQDYQTYQFPVDDDVMEEAADATDGVAVNKKPASSRSALKKVSVSSNIEEIKERKKAGFSDSVEFIDSTETNLEDSIVSYPSVDHLVTDVHPSNMEFSDEVLKGREVVFHTIPKDAPLRIAIRGGSNTALGGSIFISAIREGGAVDRYGNLTVGDQILVVDGISLIEVTHEEAVAALQRAMDMESTSIDLVIAELPIKGEQDPHDFAHHSRRGHTGHTLKNSDVNKAHQFLPKYPS